MQVNETYSLYQNRGIWHIQVCANYRKKSVSLKTKSVKEAKSRATIIFPILLENVMNDTSELSFHDLSKLWLNYDHGWSKKTKEIYTRYINLYVAGVPLPTKPNTRSMHVRCINTCWNWGFNQGLVTKMQKLKIPKSEPRVILLNDGEYCR